MCEGEIEKSVLRDHHVVTSFLHYTDVSDRRAASVRPTRGCSFFVIFPTGCYGCWVKTTEITIWCARITVLNHHERLGIKYGPLYKKQIIWNVLVYVFLYVQLKV